MASSAPGRQLGAGPPPSPLQSPRLAQPNFFRPRYYTKQQVEDEAPSVKAGMTPKRVAVFRKNYVNMINNVCKLLRLNTFVSVAAITFCHHFYLVKTMQKNDKMLVAMAAVFLASKSENHPRSLDDVLNASFKDQYGKDKEMGARMAGMMRDRQQHDWLRDSVLKAERALLYVLGFRFQVDQPSPKLVDYATRFKLDTFYKPANLATAPKLSQIAANFLNDMWKGTLSLQYPAAVLAAGCLYSALKVTRVEVPLIDGKPWYELAAGATHAQFEAFDAELMKGYRKELVPAKGGANKGGTAKGEAGSKPGATAAGATVAGATVADQKPMPPAVRTAVPPAPGTPVSAGSTPVQRLGPAARERSPDGSNDSSEPTAKRARTDAAGATPAANGNADGSAAPAQPPPPQQQQQQQQNGWQKLAPLALAAESTAAVPLHSSSSAAVASPGARASAAMPPGLGATDGPAQPGS